MGRWGWERGDGMCICGGIYMGFICGMYEARYPGTCNDECIYWRMNICLYSIDYLYKSLSSVMIFGKAAILLTKSAK